MSRESETANSAGLTGEDYEEIVEAVMETSRGRWFLEEFSRRNRTADTSELLTAINRLENAISSDLNTTPKDVGPNTSAIRSAIGEMAAEINATKREIASIGRDNEEGKNIAGATAELDAVMDATETATSDILEAAEAVQEMAWTLREENVADAICDALDLRATEIYTACSFQDITGQRTQKVVRLLQNLDQRISILAKLWADHDSGEIQITGPQDSNTPVDPLLNGPALGDQGVSQTEVDQMMDTVAWEEDATSETSASREPAASEAADKEETAATEAKAPEASDEKTQAADVDTDVDFENLSQKDMDALFA